MVRFMILISELIIGLCAAAFVKIIRKFKYKSWIKYNIAWAFCLWFSSGDYMKYEISIMFRSFLFYSSSMSLIIFEHFSHPILQNIYNQAENTFFCSRFEL